MQLRAEEGLMKLMYVLFGPALRTTLYCGMSATSRFVNLTNHSVPGNS
jgi:hypothetical protein